MKKVFLEISQQVCNFIKKETLAQVFSCEFCEISKNTFFTEHLRLLLAETIVSHEEFVQENQTFHFELGVFKIRTHFI